MCGIVGYFGYEFVVMDLCVFVCVLGYCGLDDEG